MKTRKRVTNQHLSAAIESVSSLLKDQSGLLDAYRSTIADTAFWRLERLSPQSYLESENKGDRVALDCLVLLVVSISGDPETFSSGSYRERELVESASDLIESQYSVLESISPQIWDAARETLSIATQLAERDHLDVVERLLVALDKTTRKTIGAYFTPAKLADQIVARAAETARQNFGLVGGFADATSRTDVLRRLGISEPAPGSGSDPFLCFLDPAAGVGTFLIACLRQIKTDFSHRVASSSEVDWCKFLRSTIQRVRGVELHPALAAICHFRLFDFYTAELGCAPASKIPVVCGDALCDPDSEPKGALAKLQEASIVVGNPPFGALSVNSNSWIKGLMRGAVDGVSYFEVDGQPLNERKNWLHDDYVKFFRLAQYWVRCNRAGIVAFVSNRSYVDNLTFRAMRWQMLQQFSEIEVNELAGSDEHFPIVADVASAIFCTHSEGGSSADSIVNYRNAAGVKRFVPSSPHFLFRPTAIVPRHYQESVPLHEAMPFHGSVAITARDYFVVDVDPEPLRKRIAEFCDLKISDDEIRARYFHRTRSRRYPSGDTRSWKMADKRRELADINWESHIRRCDYRPFDRRWVLWSESMIDWPRNENMAMFDIPGNFALLARRQSPADQPACYFWATNHITIDGILRSDNRGNESMFPVWVRDADGQPVANFSDSFLQKVKSRWSRLGIERAESEFALTLAQYIYGLFYCSDYRKSFHEPLTSGFPRILLSPNRTETNLLIDVGRKLLDCHLQPLGSDSPELSVVETSGGNDHDRNRKIVYCKEEGQIDLEGMSFDNVSPEDWNFRVGAHQVLRKWLKARTRREGGQLESQFRNLIQSVQQTRELMQQLECVSVS